jgi:hypothetical protein
MQNVHEASVSRKESSVKHIDSLSHRWQDRVMTNAPSNVLVLAGTGKTGSRVAAKLTKLGLSVRTAARNGADVRFEWDDPTTHSPALKDVDRVYLVAPVMRIEFADQVSSFLDSRRPPACVTSPTSAPSASTRPRLRSPSGPWSST